MAVALAENVARADDVRVTERLRVAELVVVPENERERVDVIDRDPSGDADTLSVIHALDVATACVKLHVRPAVCVPVIVVVPEIEGDSTGEIDPDVEKLGDAEKRSVEVDTCVGNGECDALLLAASVVVRVAEKNAETLVDCDAKADADGAVRVACGDALTDALAVNDFDGCADDDSTGDDVGVDAAVSEGAPANDGCTSAEAVDVISELALGEAETL